MNELEQLLTGADVARRLCVSRERVRQLAVRDDFPSPLGRVGNYIVWRADDVEQWIAANRPTLVLARGSSRSPTGA